MEGEMGGVTVENRGNEILFCMWWEKHVVGHRQILKYRWDIYETDGLFIGVLTSLGRVQFVFVLQL